MGKYKILVVDDEESLCEILKFNLELEGYEVDVAYSAEQALAMHPERYSLLLLDVMMGEISGFKMARMLKSSPETAAVPIIFCTAKDTEDDTVAGLNIGADDYIAKPFRPRELVSRIRSVLRRHQRGGYESLDAGNVRLWPDSRRVEVAGREVELLRKEYDILHYFMSRPNHTVDKTALAEGVWGDHIDQADNFDFVYAQMKNLRRKLHDAGADIEIRAVYGFGYKLVQP